MIDMHEWLIPFDKIKTTDGTKTKQAICCVWFYCLNAFCFYTAKSPSRGVVRKFACGSCLESKTI